MSDFKSKLPDLKELSSMASKLFNGIKKSVDEIVEDYKQKRAEDEEHEEVAKAATKSAKETASSEDKETKTAKASKTTDDKKEG